MALQEGEREGVACGKHHQVNVVLNSAVLKNDTGATEFTHIWLYLDSARNKSIWQIIINRGVLTENSERM